jgi:hypothetical protein
MQPGLSAYARAITHDPKVRVEVATGAPRTDGTVIYYRPPIALGDPTRHDRFLCGKRDENKLQSCPACKIREEVLVNIYHEIDHIAFGTFIQTTDRAKKDAINKAIEEWGGKYEIQLRTKITQAPPNTKNTYLGLANLISPYLPHLFNCMEDARIECAMFEARPGTRKMFQADVLNMVRLGMPDAMNTEDRKPYREMDLNSQMALAVYMDTVGYVGWQDYFHEKVITDSTDSEIQHQVEKLRIARNASDVYYLTFPMMARLRELGYFLMPEDQPQQGDDSDSGQQDQGDESRESSDASQGESSDREDQSDNADQQGTSDQKSDSSDSLGDEASEDTPGTPSGGAGSQGQPEAIDNGDDSDASDNEGLGGSGDQGDSLQSSPSSGNPQQGPGGSSQSSEDLPSGSDDEDQEQDQGDLDADSDSVSEESGESGSNNWPGEVSDFFGSDQTDSSEQSDQGANEAADEDVSDDGAGGDQASTESDNSDDHELSDEHNDSQESESADQSDDSGDSESEGDEPGQIQDSGSPSESLDNGATSETDDRFQEERSDERRDGPELEELNPEGDEGLGGVKVNEVEEDLPDYGTPEDMEAAFGQIHPELQPGDSVDLHGSIEEQKAIEIAVTQGTYFEWPSTSVESIFEHRRGEDNYGWREGHDLGDMSNQELKVIGIICDTDIPESVLSEATLKIRRIFDDNKTANYQRHLRSGRVNSKVLGRRAWKGDDDRLFQKKRIPGKKDYAVLIEMDISSSNLNGNLALLKRSVFAQAELLSRVGVQFAIVAHSCEGRGLRSTGYTLHLHHVKDWNEPWDSKRKAAVANLVGIGGNLDGHAMEYGRKRLGEVEATDKILLYYTDGKFPAANKEEELEVLLHQLKLCQRDQITLLGVGIRTDSPRRFGLDTVQVDDDSDLQRVVEHLGQRLQRSAR